MEYFIGIRGVQSGPFNEAEIRDKIARNVYPSGTLCWTDGWPQWRTLESVFPSNNAAPPPLPTTPAPAFPTPGFHQPYHTAATEHAAPQTAGVAIASLILGLAGFFTFFSAIPAIICGHVACSEIKKSAGRKTGRGMAIAGLIMGYSIIAFFPAVIAAAAIPAFNKVRVLSQEKAVKNNLRQLDAAAEQFMLENGVKRATYTDLVGGGDNHYIRELKPLAGEDYSNIIINKDDTSIKVTLADGRVVVLDRFHTSDNSSFSNQSP